MLGKDGGVGLLILIILIIAAVTGTLWQVLQIAFGVALGIFLASVLLSLAVYYFVRSRVRRLRRDAHRRYQGGPPERY
jgi:membrane protein implicated in regulation of membrane protease activity